MNILDIIIILILGVFIIKGLLRGFIKEVIAFIGLPIAFFLAVSYSSTAALYLEELIPNSTYRSGVSFIVIFLAAYFLIALSGLLLDKFMTMMMAKPLNTALGAAVGFIKAAFLGSILFLLIAAFAPPDSSLLRESQTWPYFQPWTNFMMELFPKDLQKHFSLEDTQLPDTLKDKVKLEIPKSITKGVKGLTDEIKEQVKDLPKPDLKKPFAQKAEEPQEEPKD